PQRLLIPTGVGVLRAGRRVNRLIEHIGVKVDTVRPTDRSSVFVNTDACEVHRITEWFEDPTATDQPRPEVNRTARPVREGQLDGVRANHCDVYHSRIHTHSRPAIFRGA